MEAHDLARRPIHLGLGVTAEVEPAFTNDMACYGAYLVRHICDGSEGRLLSLYTFMEPWGAWEVHPQGSEAVVCTNGSLTPHQGYRDGSISRVTLVPGQFAINPPGTWHTADVESEATALFITAELGTQHRSR